MQFLISVIERPLTGDQTVFSEGIRLDPSTCAVVGSEYCRKNLRDVEVAPRIQTRNLPITDYYNTLRL